MEKPFGEGVMGEDFSRLTSLYPYADLSELPLCWVNKDKTNFISLTDNNLKVQYKGNAKNNKDAASVRTSQPIPSSCLLYYFEIKVLSKGRDGYMGIGLAAQGANMQRLPGWDKRSYGYHGDDGNTFCSSGTGQPYGPMFTTGDIIGCGYNIVENNCFFTKNGHNLGIAFPDLPNIPLYPTIGLQTPGEKVKANFGLEPFCYEIEDDLRALRQRITANIINHPVKYTEWQSTINKIILSWLIHNSYCSTAEVFSSLTKQEFKENVQQIKQRLKIQQLVLAGKIEEAIQLTNEFYPDVLTDNPNLLFALKCRQFVEMISETCGKKTASPLSPSSSSTKSPHSSSSDSSNNGFTEDPNGSTGSTCKISIKTQSLANNNATSSSSSPSTKTAHPSNVICSPSSSSNSLFSCPTPTTTTAPSSNPTSTSGFSSTFSNMTSNLASASNLYNKNLNNTNNNNHNINNSVNNGNNNCKSNDADAITNTISNNVNNCNSNNLSSSASSNGLKANDCNGNSFGDEMDIDHEPEEENQSNSSNGNTTTNSSTTTSNNKSHSTISCTDELSHHNNNNNSIDPDDASHLSNLINFGRELHKLSKQLKKKSGSNDQNKKMLLQVSSLMAYSDPTKSPIAWQLNPSEREHVCQQLNNAIVMSELGGCSPRPPLETIIKHTKSLLKYNGQCGAWLLDKL